MLRVLYIYIYIEREREIYTHWIYIYIYIHILINQSINIYIYIYIYVCINHSTKHGYCCSGCNLLVLWASRSLNRCHPFERPLRGGRVRGLTWEHIYIYIYRDRYIDERIVEAEPRRAKLQIYTTGVEGNHARKERERGLS